MFWLTLVLGIIMGLLSRSLIRQLLQKCLPRILDRHFDLVLIILLGIISGVSVVKYRQEEARKAALARELDVLRSKADQATFAPFSDESRNQVKARLENIRKRFGPSLPVITISADSGNQNRVKIADEMGALLRASGFDVKVRSSQLFSQSREPIKAIFRPEDRQLIQEILMAFESVLHATVGTQEVGNRPGDEVVVLIQGEPKFTPEGIKIFE